MELCGADNTHRTNCAGGPGPAGRRGSLSGLVVNEIVGVVLLFLTNLFLADDLPINLLTIAMCALGGVAG